MKGTRVSVDLPASLKTAAERYASQDGVSLNQFIACSSSSIADHLPSDSSARRGEDKRTL